MLPYFEKLYMVTGSKKQALITWFLTFSLKKKIFLTFSRTLEKCESTTV